jgi:hypothetical protein
MMINDFGYSNNKFSKFICSNDYSHFEFLFNNGVVVKDIEELVDLLKLTNKMVCTVSIWALEDENGSDYNFSYQNEELKLSLQRQHFISSISGETRFSKENDVYFNKISEMLNFMQLDYLTESGNVFLLLNDIVEKVNDIYSLNSNEYYVVDSIFYAKIKFYNENMVDCNGDCTVKRKISEEEFKKLFKKKAKLDFEGKVFLDNNDFSIYLDKLLGKLVKGDTLFACKKSNSRRLRDILSKLEADCKKKNKHNKKVQLDVNINLFKKKVGFQEFHYLAIPNIKNLIGFVSSKFKESSFKGYCDFCFSYFDTLTTTYASHLQSCSSNYKSNYVLKNECKVTKNGKLKKNNHGEFSKKKNTESKDSKKEYIKFEKFQNRINNMHICFSDFESLLVKSDEDDGISFGGSSEKLNKHIPLAFGMLFFNYISGKHEYIKYLDENGAGDVSDKFIKMLVSLSNAVKVFNQKLIEAQTVLDDKEISCGCCGDGKEEDFIFSIQNQEVNYDCLNISEIICDEEKMESLISECKEKKRRVFEKKLRRLGLKELDLNFEEDQSYKDSSDFEEEGEDIEDDIEVENSSESQEEEEEDKKSKIEIVKQKKKLKKVYIGNSKAVNLCRKCQSAYFAKLKCVIVYFHNLRGYDGHYIIDSLFKFFDSKKIKIIAITKEKYMTFQVKINGITFKFVDSLAFINSSLAVLAERTFNSQDFIPKIFSFTDEDRKSGFADFLKQVLPYEYLDDYSKLDLDFPPLSFIDENGKLVRPFFSRLKNADISFEEWSFAKNKFEKMGFNSMKEWLMYYMEIDVKILAEVMINHSEMLKLKYDIYPANYISAPSHSWCSMLKFSGVKLELCNDRRIVDYFTEHGVIKGGLSQASSLKYSKANTKINRASEESVKGRSFLCNSNNPGRCLEEYNENKIMYFDVTNLYGHAMTFPLPTGNFELLTTETKSQLELFEMYSFYKSKGYDFYDNSDFGVSIVFNASIIESKRKEMFDLPILPHHKNGKLVTSLEQKIRYTSYIKNVMQAEESGYEITFIHSILTFSQEPFMKGYIEYNTKSRSETKNECLRNIFKLQNNSVYGKTMENIFKRKSYEFVRANDIDGQIELLTKKNFNMYERLSENIYIFDKKNKICLFDKPIYAGFLILEHSKFIMFNLLKNIKKVNESAKLMYMDTDSLIFNFKKFSYRGMEEFFDLSVYESKEKCIAVHGENFFDPKNKGKLGTLKDEYPLTPIKEFIAIKSKIYVMELDTLMFPKKKSQVIKYKGISETTSKLINIDVIRGYFFNGIKFFECFDNGDLFVRVKDYKKGKIVSDSIKTNQVKIQSKKHIMFTIKNLKKTFSEEVKDDKRINCTLCLKKYNIRIFTFPLGISSREMECEHYSTHVNYFKIEEVEKLCKYCLAEGRGQLSKKVSIYFNKKQILEVHLNH